jgi:hypothetical protein
MALTIVFSVHCVAPASCGRISIETFAAEAAGLVTFRLLAAG